MKLLSSLFDLALIPVAMINDVEDFLCGSNWDGKSYTRTQLEKVEEDLGL